MSKNVAPKYRVEERTAAGALTALLVFDTKTEAAEFFDLRLRNSASSYAPDGRWRLLLLGPDSRRGA